MEARTQTRTFGVHTYASEGAGSVNTHWIETEEGVVVVDGQRQISQARRAVEQIGRSGKPIVAIFVTHGHPDHVGGLGVLVEAAGPGVPVYASEATVRTVREDESGFLALARRVLGDDYPEEVAFPNHQAMARGDVVPVGGLEFEAHELGPGEAPSTTALRVLGSGALFPGDLVSNRFTPLLTEGHSGEWVGQLEAAPEAFDGAVTAYPGHGRPGAWPNLVASELEYLRTFRALVAEAAGGNAELSDGARAAVAEETGRRFPDHPFVVELPNLVELNADAVARELAGARP